MIANLETKRGKGSPSAIILPDTSGKTICVEFRNTISLEDYNMFMAHVIHAADKYGSFNLLFHYSPSFNGWEPDAADANMKAIIEFGRDVDRLAYVNPPQKKIMQHKIAPKLFGGEMRYFDENQLEDAIEWIKGG